MMKSPMVWVFLILLTLKVANIATISWWWVMLPAVLTMGWYIYVAYQVGVELKRRRNDPAYLLTQYAEQLRRKR